VVRRMPVRIEGEVLMGLTFPSLSRGEGRVRQRTHPESRGKAHTRWCSKAYRVATLREETPSLL
jgi:hypothetical protein